MWSLKGFIGPMSRELGMTPAALYERQRALVRAGILECEEGKGPGSGVRATPRTVALVLVAALAAEGLSNVEESTPLIAKAKAAKCQISGAENFLDAMTWALKSPVNAKLVAHVGVSHTQQHATVLFRRGRGHVLTEFGAKSPAAVGIDIEAHLSGDVIKQITDLLYVTIKEEWS